MKKILYNLLTLISRKIILTMAKIIFPEFLDTFANAASLILNSNSTIVVKILQIFGYKIV